MGKKNYHEYYGLDGAFRRVIEDKLRKMSRNGSKYEILSYIPRSLLVDTSSLITASQYSEDIFSTGALRDLQTRLYVPEGIMEEIKSHEREISDKIIKYFEEHAYLVREGEVRRRLEEFGDEIDSAIDYCKKKKLIKGEVGKNDKSIIAVALALEKPSVVISEDAHIREPLKVLLYDRRYHFQKPLYSKGIIAPVTYGELIPHY
jgi:rRNA-processing protein FCF1